MDIQEIENKIIDFIKEHGGKNVTAYTATTRVIQYELDNKKFYVSLDNEGYEFVIEDTDTEIENGILDFQSIIDALVECECVK